MKLPRDTFHSPAGCSVALAFQCTLYEASNNGVDWEALKNEFNYLMGPTPEQVGVNAESYFQYDRLFVYEANGENPGLRHLRSYND